MFKRQNACFIQSRYQVILHFCVQTLSTMAPFYKTTLMTGLFVGLTDIIAACVSAWIKSGNFPAKMLHYIAGGLVGLETSMKGGIEIALLGLLIHFFIAYAWTMFFF